MVPTRALRWVRQLVVLPMAIGAVVGTGAAIFYGLVVLTILPVVEGAPVGVAAIAPWAGLAVAITLLDGRRKGRLLPATVDEYLLAFHESDRALEMRDLPRRMVATVATVGCGGALGLGAPSLFAGATVGNTVQQRLSQLMAGCDRRVLMVAGAAAGGGAIWRVPLTAALFVVEAPFRRAIAGRLLVPALAGGGAGYLAFVAVHGDTSLLSLAPAAALGPRELGGAVLIGILAALGARGFVWLVMRARMMQATAPIPLRMAVAGPALAALAVLSYRMTETVLTLGPGIRAGAWAIGDWPVSLIAAVILLRLLATATAVGVGGAGGLTTPLLISGAMLGQTVGILAGAGNRPLMMVIGAGTFFAVNYRVPLTGIVFVAEATGRPLFVVPAVLASVIGHALMRSRSITLGQRPGHRDRKTSSQSSAARKYGA